MGLYPGVPPMEPYDALRRVRSTTVAPPHAAIKFPCDMRGNANPLPSQITLLKRTGPTARSSACRPAEA
jgi:hypothetical protein